jgi:hypothetical protein
MVENSLWRRMLGCAEKQVNEWALRRFGGEDAQGKISGGSKGSESGNRMGSRTLVIQLPIGMSVVVFWSFASSPQTFATKNSTRHGGRVTG